MECKEEVIRISSDDCRYVIRTIVEAKIISNQLNSMDIVRGARIIKRRCSDKFDLNLISDQLKGMEIVAINAFVDDIVDYTIKEKVKKYSVK